MDYADAMMLRRTMTTLPRARSLVALVAFGLVAAGCGAEVPEATPQTTASAGVAPPQLDPNAAPSTSLAPPPPTRAQVEALGYTYGSADAPIHVIEMSDFGCGYCKLFHDETFPVLLEEYVNTGKVFWRFIPFDVGMFPNAQGALNAGVCAGEQGMIHEAGQLLFNRQREWKRTGDVSNELLAIVRDGGVDVGNWQECVESGRRSADAAANTLMARRLGVRGTPTFFVDGYPIQGSLPLDTFREIFNSVLSERETATSE